MTKSEATTPRSGISLLLRLPSTGMPIERVADAHQKVIATSGSVWLGILGRRYSEQNVGRIRRDGESFYLVQRTNGETVVFKGNMSDVSYSLAEEQRSLVPEYYRESGISERAKLWVHLSSLTRIATRELEKLSVVSSGKDASVLLTGMACLGIVERK